MPWAVRGHAEGEEEGKLSTKALRFVIAAVSFHADHLDALWDHDPRAEDERADAGHDAMYLLEIAKDLEAEHQRLVADPDAH